MKENGNEIAMAAALEQLDQAHALLKRIENYLNDSIAVLPCESRQRDLPEDDWEYLMFLRDEIDSLFRLASDRG